MDQSDAVMCIGDALTQLDVQLMSGNPPSQSAQWQALYTKRKSLDDQQRLLVQKTFEEDDSAFQSITDQLSTDTTALDKEIATTARIKQILTIVSQISSDVDQLLKLAP